MSNKCVNRACGKTISKVGLIKNYSKHPKGTMPYLTSYSTALCSKCRELMSKKHDIYVTCTVCKESILVKHITGGVRLTCSEQCRIKRSSILSKERYRKENPRIDKRCVTCNKRFTKILMKKRSNTMYCSVKCTRDAYVKRRRLQKQFAMHLRMIKLGINLK